MVAWPKPTSETPETITLTRADWAALQDRLEDQADSARADKIIAAINAGTTKLIPFKLTQRMLAGEHPVRVWRQYRGFTQIALATASGVPAADLAAIERGAKPASVSTLLKLSRPLAVTIDDLVAWETK